MITRTAADLIVVNGCLRTQDADCPAAEALAVCGGEIVAVGRNVDMAVWQGPETKVLDAQGATVLPGLIESHMHLFLGGAALGHLSAAGLCGLEALTLPLTVYRAANPSRKVLLVQGAEYSWFSGQTPPRRLLDALCGEVPLLLIAGDQHTAWSNTAGLRAAGLERGASLPPGNEVCVDASGFATGTLREFQAFAPLLALAGEGRVSLGLVSGREPDPAPDAEAEALDLEILARGLRHCAKLGITSIVNMDGNHYQLHLLQRLRAAGRLTARVRVPFHLRPDRDPADLSLAAEWHREFSDRWLCSGFVKLFMDGVIDSGTALVKDPGMTSGPPLFSAEAFAAHCVAIDRMGLQIAVHAIGDGAVSRVLDGYAAARHVNGPRDARHRIEHIELLDRSDLPRMKSLGVVASIQPCHVPGGQDFPLQPTLGLIPESRRGDAYLADSLLQAGIPLAFASDWPVADVNPFRCMQTAMTRAPFSPRLPSERVLPEQALAAYTAGGAYAEHTESWKGRLKPGFVADFIVLEGDLREVSPSEWGAVRVRQTFCGGRCVWDAWNSGAVQG